MFELNYVNDCLSFHPTFAQTILQFRQIDVITQGIFSDVLLNITKTPLIILGWKNCRDDFKIVCIEVKIFE